MKDYYKKARDNLDIKIDDTFDTYRTHGIVHVLDVFTQSLNTYGAFQSAGAENLSLNSILLASVMHDTGMSGGKQLAVYLDNEELKIDILDEVQKSGKNVRESHSYNSGDIILKNADYLQKFYSDEEIAEAALLAFAHSKSNSGLKSLDSEAGWSFAIKALAQGHQKNKSTFDFLGILEKSGIIKGLSSQMRKVEIKSPDYYLGELNPNEKNMVSKEKGGTKKGKIQIFNFGDGIIKKLSYEALGVRIGDALTNNDNAGTNQYGMKIVDVLSDCSKQKTIKELAKIYNTSEEDLIKTIIDSDEKLTKAAIKESENVTYKVQTNDGTYKDYTKSQPFVCGEANQTYEINNNGKDVIVTVKVKDTNKLPLCTLFAIDERLGELETKGSSIFYDDGSRLKLEIEIDPSADESIQKVYEQYAQRAGEKIEVNIKYKD